MNSTIKTVAAVPQKDPLVVATRKARFAEQRAYRSTRIYEVDRLLAEETRWKRKLTIATNKLAWVRERINALAVQLAKDLEKAR